MTSSKREFALFTNEFFPYRGGIAMVCEELARAAHQLQVKLEVWCPQSPEIEAKNFPFSVVQLPIKSSQKPDNIKVLADCLLQRIHQWQSKSIVFAEPGPIRCFMDAELHGLSLPESYQVILHGSEILRMSKDSRKKFESFLERAERVFCVSHYSLSELTKVYPQFKERALVIHPALRSTFLQPNLEKMAAKRKSRSQNAFTIVNLARISPRKGQHRLIWAIAKLPSEIKKKVELRLIGPTISRLYRNYLTLLCRIGNVRSSFLGQLEDSEIAEEFYSADLFAMTPIQFFGSVEGFGLVYLEAARFGLPIVAHQIGGVPEAVSHLENGLLVDPKSSKALTQAIDKLITNDKLRNQLADKSLAWSERFSWKENAKKVFSI